MKAYTDLEQSKKLAEILPIESADMFYRENGTDVKLMWEHLKNIPVTTPCWSLDALLNILPDTITSNDGIAFKLNIKKNIIEYSNPSLYLIYKASIADNLIDACYEMIIRLHDLNLL